MNKRSQIIISISILIGFLLLFSKWEYSTTLVGSADIGKRVSFSEPMDVYIFIPETVAGSLISSKYNAVIVARYNEAYKLHLKDSNLLKMEDNTVYEVVTVIQVKVLGLIHKSFKASSIYYILRDPEGRLLPMRKALYEDSKKIYY
jgi:hypothetical protein